MEVYTSGPTENFKKNILQSLGLVQHVVQPTHRSGHMRDRLITRDTDTFLGVAGVTNDAISDHIWSEISAKLIELMEKSRLFDPLQSDRWWHSAVRKQDFWGQVWGEGTVLLLLDLSASLDRMDHTILPNRMELELGV